MFVGRCLYDIDSETLTNKNQSLTTQILFKDTPPPTPVTSQPISIDIEYFRGCLTVNYKTTEK